MRLPTVGEIFEAKYEIRAPLGRGGFATVFRATDLSIGRDVAIKVLAPRDGEYPPGIVARFMVEARVIAGLQDPHTIRLFEFGKSADGLLYMVFQYVAGLDLSGVLKERGALAPEIAVHITRQVLFALAEAHNAGVLHRDLKPGNIIVHEYMGDEFSAKLLDFGIAKADVNEAAGAGLTKEGTLLGTPRYMAPEQIFGEPLTAASDIYSLGLVLFEMLAGQPAVQGSQKEILIRQVSADPHVLPPGVGWPALRQVVGRMTAREPSQRFQTAFDVVAALDFALDQRASSSGPVSAPNPVPPARMPSGPQHPRPTGPTGQDPAAPRPGPPTVTADAPPSAGRRALAIAGICCVAIGAFAAVFTMRNRERAEVVKPSPGSIPSALLKAAPAPSEPVAAPPDAGFDAAFDAGAAVLDGCGVKLGKLSAKQERWLYYDVASLRRAVRIYLPPDYDPNHRYPVVLTVHHKNGDEHYYVGRTDLVPYMKKGKFIILAPDALDRFDPWTARGDLEFLKSVVPVAAQHYCIDRTRIYGTGHQEGAAILRRLACEMPFSAIATSGDGERVGVKSCEPDPPVPMLRLLGKEDLFVPPAGGPGCLGVEYLSVAQHNELWRKRNGCSGPDRRWSKRPRACTTWKCSDAPYVSCEMPGGHYLAKTNWRLFDPPNCKSPVVHFPLGNTLWDFFRTEGRVLPEVQTP